jgi:hypothetical protein
MSCRGAGASCDHCSRPLFDWLILGGGPWRQYCPFPVATLFSGHGWKRYRWRHSVSGREGGGPKRTKNSRTLPTKGDEKRLEKRRLPERSLPSLSSTPRSPPSHHTANPVGLLPMCGHKLSRRKDGRCQPGWSLCQTRGDGEQTDLVYTLRGDDRRHVVAFRLGSFSTHT